MWCLRHLAFLIIVAAAAGSTAAQLRAPVTGAADPFRIGPGSTFTASGGSGRVSSSAIRSIANDISEAEAIILGNHFKGKKVDSATITRSALEGMLHSLDPHSNYHDPAEWKELLDEQNSGYTGVGVTIGDFSFGNAFGTYVLSATPGSAAARANVRFGDRIVAVNGRDVSAEGVVGVRDLLRGDSGTTLRLTLERAATGRIEVVELKRNVISQPSIPDAYIVRQGIGYIDLSEGFNYTTAAEFTRALSYLKKQGMRSLVLDLRGNGGGILDQAVKIAEIFLPSGTKILSQRGRFASDTRSYYSSNAAPEMIPLVVLVNSRTASASEILAGALQDEDRALIVGEKTYGKGLVQTVIDLPGGAGLTLTTGRYLTPAGRSIQRDYSGVDLYDYYNQKGPASGTGKAFFEARTVTDRRVFGGDGIHPDEEVKHRPITGVQAALLDSIFYFAREIANGRIAFSQLTTPGSTLVGKMSSGSQKVSNELLAALSESFGKQRPLITQKVLIDEAHFISIHLRYYLDMASNGSVQANRILNAADPQVVLALDALPRAESLAKLAEKAR